MSYVVSRTAKNNPEINGRKLYYTRIGLWTLDRDLAKVFNSEAEVTETEPTLRVHTIERVPE